MNEVFLPRPQHARIAWIDVLRVLCMWGVFLSHSSLYGAWTPLYASASVYGFILLSGYLFVRPGAEAPLFPARKVLQLLVVYVFWIVALKVVSGFGDVLSGHRPEESLLVKCLPSWDDFLYTAEPALGQLWWFRNYLIAMCAAGLFYRLPTPLLLCFSVLCMGISDSGIFGEFELFRPVMAGMFGLGLLAARATSGQVERMAGRCLPVWTSLGCFVLLLAFFTLPLYQHGCNSMLALACMLFLACGSNGIDRGLPRVSRFCSALAPSLMIFYIIHMYALRVVHSIYLHKFDRLPNLPETLLMAACLFAVSYGIYLFSSRYSAVLSYLCLCKYRNREGL